MDVGVLGVNYRFSGLEPREQFAKCAQKLIENVLRVPHVLLSTCNRTEIYFSSDNLAKTYSQLLSDLKKVTVFDLDLAFYCYFDRQCFLHLSQVVAGIDSLIFGEAEIQRQVKKAYEQAKERRSLSPPLHHLFQKSIKIGKEIRTVFGLPKGPVSLEGSLWDLSRCFFSEEQDIRALFIGHSEINRKIMPFFRSRGVSRLHLATRQPKLAQELKDKLSLTLLPWEEKNRWVDFDIVVSSSLSSEYVLTKESLNIQEMPIRNKVIFDLSLPRNIDPLIGKHPSVSLFNIEEIGHFMEQRQKGSWQEGCQIQEKIEEMVSWQMNCYEKKQEKDLLYAMPAYSF